MRGDAVVYNALEKGESVCAMKNGLPKMGNDGFDEGGLELI